MLRKIELNGNDLIGFEAKGKITAEDYQKTLVPVIEKFKHQNKKIRFLYYLGPDFEGFTAGAGWEDAKLGYHYLSTFDRCAIVTDIGWIRHTSHFFGSLMPLPVKVFANSELNDAQAWLNSGDIGLNHHLDEASGVLTLEITGPLSSDNFEVLTQKVDTWLERNNHLKGLIIHAKAFPGWENVGSFIHHIQFVKNHHRKIQHVVFCMDSALPNLMPIVAKHFVEAKIKSFKFDQLIDAQKWILEV